MAGSGGMGRFWERDGVGTFQYCVGSVFEVDSFLPQAIGQPVVLVQTEAGRKRKVGAHPHEHPAPLRIDDVEVILVDPTLLVLQMRAVVVLVPHSDQDSSWFTRF